MDSKTFAPRRGRRRRTGLAASCRGDDGLAKDVAVTDLSESGCRVATEPGAVAADEAVVVRPQGLDALSGRVKWAHEKTAGIEFASALHPAVVDHLAGDAPLEGGPPQSPSGKSGFTDRFGRPLPRLGSRRR